MVVSFPHMGNGWPAFKSLCENMGAEVYVPKESNVKQLELGLKNSPEWVCFPFKVTLSNMIDALESGVKIIVMATDCGPCRFGFYYAVQERILRDMGYDFEMIHLPQGDLLTFEWVDFLKSICEEKKLASFKNISKTVRVFLMKLYLIKLAEECEGATRCYEINKGETTKVLKKCLLLIDTAVTYNELKRLKRQIPTLFSDIKMDKKRSVVSVKMTGENFVAVDEFSNQNIKRKLGELGCKVYMGTSLYDWVKHKFHLNFHRKYLEYLNKKNRSKGGLQMDIGGEAIWVLGDYISSSQEGKFDGFVHIYPFTCMPEITAKAIITKWYGDGDFNLPPFFFSFDEHSGEAGLITRLEAYVDLLKKRSLRDIVKK
jgi:predicted nucleotide-binding protein (sugar kinase/HSP70/actin superfamily)